MDLSPPSLTRSPSSPSNTYCPSERSSLDYPSPGLVEQQYKLSPIYGAEPACSLAPALEVVETLLPPLDAMSQSNEWGATVIHPSSSATSMPSIVSPEYSTFGGYDSMPSSSYGHPAEVYHHHHAHPTSVPGHMTPRVNVKMETASEYGQPMDVNVNVSHYPSPRSVQSVSSVPVSYGGDHCNSNSAYTTSPAPGYMSDSGPYHHEQYYSPSQSHSSTFSMQDARRAYRTQRPRRAPRRLTTKEEANFQCEVKGCGKLFSRSYNFKAHMETHDEKREYPFPCTMAECNKKFVRKTDLQRHHSSVHAKERNHKCDYCSRMFARKDTLRRHMEDGCSKRFDIGTLDLRADGYNRPMSAPIGHVVPPPGGLPPMAIPPLGSNGTTLTPMPQHMRPRELEAPSWGR